MKSFIRPARTFALSATSFIFTAITTVFVMSLLAACVGRPVSSAPGSSALTKVPAKKTMRAFGSEEELKNYFAEARKRTLERARREASANPPPAPSANQAATSVAKAGEGVLRRLRIGNIRK